MGNDVETWTTQEHQLAVVVGAVSPTAHVYIHGNDACLPVARYILASDWLAAREVELRESIAAEIETTFTDPERVRPTVTDAEFPTDLANDWQWCADIARGAKP